jgi:lysophospholipase L1-like esterase
MSKISKYLFIAVLVCVSILIYAFQLKFKSVVAIDAVQQIQGRYELNKGNLFFSISGVSLTFKPNASSIEVLLESFSSVDSSQYNWMLVVDQNNTPIDTLVLFPGKHWYVVVCPPNKNMNHITFIKATESFVGKIGCYEVKGVEERKGVLSTVSTGILFIGNSITCGYGNQVLNYGSSSGFHAINENAYDSYAMLTARKLNAPIELVSFSGIGIYRNFNGDTVSTMPNIFNKVHLHEPQSIMWNHYKQTPKLICINLGTNDYFLDSQDQPLNEKLFNQKYITFIKHLHTVYPHSKILIMNGSMLNDYWPVGKKCFTRMQERLTEIKTIVNNEYPSLVYSFVFTPQQSPYGEDYHPSKQTHQFMSEELIIFIQSNKLYTHE